MHLARTILALVIAVSVATLPVAGSASIVAKPSDIVASAERTTSGEVSSAMSAMDDCCPDHAKPCDQRGDQCQSMAACAIQFVALAHFAFASLSYPAPAANPVPALADSPLPPFGGSPPFRPPRV